MAGEAPEATVRLFSYDVEGTGRVRRVVEHLSSCLENLTQSLNLREGEPVSVRDGDANIYPDKDSPLDAFPTPLVVLGASEPFSSSASIERHAGAVWNSRCSSREGSETPPPIPIPRHVGAPGRMNDGAAWRPVGRKSWVTERVSGWMPGGVSVANPRLVAPPDRDCPGAARKEGIPPSAASKPGMSPMSPENRETCSTLGSGPLPCPSPHPRASGKTCAAGAVGPPCRRMDKVVLSELGAVAAGGRSRRQVHIRLD